jgi:hypothetical protein
MKNAALQGAFATNKGARKVSAATNLLEYLRDLHTLDTFCANKQATPYPPASISDPDFKCQDENGARRFTGRECFMNLEKILAGNDPENTPVTSWNWDSDNHSPLPKSLAAARWCPFLSETTKLSEVKNYVQYADEAGTGLVRFRGSSPAVSTVTFTYGIKGTGTSDSVAMEEWNESSLLGGNFSFRIVFPFSSTISYPLFNEGVQLRDRRNLAPETKHHSGHLDHLHVETKGQ